MKMKFRFSIILLLSILNSIAQDFRLDTILQWEDHLLYLNKYENNQLKCYSKEYKNKSYLFFNQIPIDSNQIQTRSNPFFIDNKIFFNANRLENSFSIDKFNTKRIYYDIKDSMTYEFNYKFNFDINYQQCYIVDTPYWKLKLVNPMNGQKSSFMDFFDFAEHETNRGITYPLLSIDKVFFINHEVAFVRICLRGNFEGCIKYRYVVGNKGEILDVTDQIKSNYDGQKYFSEIIFTCEKNKFIRENLEIFTNSLSRKSVNRLFDENFTYISDLLVLNNPVLIGVNIQNGKLQYHFLRSFLNNEVKVIIPYKFIPQLDLAMYKAHKNNKLTEEDLEGLDLYALGILRNSIFAKYNYAFNSEFYQAYFNLFAFYNHYEKKGKRTKDINDKLTETDKYNIKLITNIEKELGK
ncbi:hypothetical protein L21SP5_00145 [Salinivirga cyanobacteriivorans]|uniref:YARHG domain-containing protein n=1 Tax=Salinivirga cyanobacteriivorans TaxID=1307839 RepID=A0A0S2HUU0_9BACT|nr:YARHG domain-containing protein [Salinivirga cyanobacteriivorans]ALO13825.1 hypothetical protein L21SP5_00145 [Salinivirga cyanobacteriivorans]